MAAMTVRLGQRGRLTVPKRLREACGLVPGQSVTVTDLHGALLLSAAHPTTDLVADALAASLAARGETLASMLAALREERDDAASTGP